MATYKLTDTPSGYKTLLYIDSREVRLHSAYDPLKEAGRTVDSFQPGRSNLIIVAGLALGYHIKLLKEKYPGHLIIVIEQAKEVIDLVRKSFPDHLTNIPVISSLKDLPAIFETIDITTLRGASSYIHRPSYTLSKKFYDMILADIKKYISSKFSDLLTRFEFEENWIDHLFKNIHNLYLTTRVSALFGSFRNIPGIIVSAGPSLKKNISLLNHLKDKALIVCVDTALMVLQKNNITPHIVMTLDSQKHSVKHFHGLKNNDSILLADIVSCPRIIETYKGYKLISTTSKYYTNENGKTTRETTPVWDWIEQFTGPIGDIQSGGSVATSVFDLLLNLGCSRIILVGQDLAYTGREIHCTGTHHNNGWLPTLSRFINLETINQNVIRKRKIKYVDAYNGKDKVISDFVFDIYKYWFKDSSGKINIPVINATEGGARIENTKEISLKQIVSTLDSLNESPDEILRSVTRNSNNKVKNPEKLINGITKALSELSELNTKYRDNDGSSSSEEIIAHINNISISGLIKPFLRKTFIYLARNPDLSREKSSELLLNEIKASSGKIIKMLEECKQNLEKIR